MSCFVRISQDSHGLHYSLLYFLALESADALTHHTRRLMGTDPRPRDFASRVAGPDSRLSPLLKAWLADDEGGPPSTGGDSDFAPRVAHAGVPYGEYRAQQGPYEYPTGEGEEGEARDGTMIFRF
jgi:hypothetical protein